MVLAIAAVIHVVVQNITGRVAVTYGQWKFVFCGLVILSIGTACVSIKEIRLQPVSIINYILYFIFNI